VSPFASLLADIRSPLRRRVFFFSLPVAFLGQGSAEERSLPSLPFSLRPYRLSEYDFLHFSQGAVICEWHNSCPGSGAGLASREGYVS